MGKHNYAVWWGLPQGAFGHTGQLECDRGRFIYWRRRRMMRLANLLADQPAGEHDTVFDWQELLCGRMSGMFMRRMIFARSANLTLNYGVRYEYFSPYTEKYDHLADLGVNSGFTQVAEVYPGCVGMFCNTVPSIAGVSVPRGYCAAHRDCVAAAEVDGGAGWVWHELYEWAVCELCDDRWRISRRLRMCRRTRRRTTAIPLEDGFPVPESAAAAELCA